jgi:hypothetical protein
MAQPPAFNRSENYTEYAAAHPGATFPPASLDGEMDDIETTLDATLSNLALIQRDDGKLANRSVHPDALSTATAALMGSWAPRGIWATATLYTIRDLIEQSGTAYVCAATHTSAASFATDTAAGRWINLGTGLPVASSIAFTPAGLISSSNVQAAIQELDGEKAPIASPAFSGNATVPTASPGDNDTSIANTAFVTNAVATATAGLAPLASPTFTGNPIGPTPSQGDADTSLATTAFVAAALQPQHSYIWNGDFRVWGNGTSARPTGWTLSGTGATAARNQTAGRFKWGTAGVDVTRSGNNCGLLQIVTNDPAYLPMASWAGKTVTLGMWVYATVADRARIYVSDGVTLTFSAYHPGDSTLRFLTVTATIGASPTSITVVGVVETGDTTATFSGATLVLGSYLADSVISYTPRKCVMPFHAGPGNTHGSGVTLYYSSGGAEATEGNAAMPVPMKCVVRRLYAYSAVAPGGSDTYIYTVRKSGADTALTCTTSAAGVTSANTTSEVEFAAGDPIDLKMVSSATANSATRVSAMVEAEEVPV